MNRIQRLGILGGSFNPIHVGHLVVAERAVEALRLDRLLLIPSADTPLKDPRSLAPARHRLAMARLAARGLDRIRVSDMELRRGGTSYTADTLAALAPTAPQIFLIVGSDALATLHRWRRLPDLARLATFAIAARPGHPVKPIPRSVRWVSFPAPLLDISATDLRRRLREGRSIRHLVPDAVGRYLIKKNLYHLPALKGNRP